MGVADWGLTMALHRVGVVAYTYFAAIVLSIVLAFVVPIVLLLDLVLTAIPYIDGLPGASWVSGFAYDVGVWTANNTRYAISGDGDFQWTAM
jgi:hypothetical protein